MTDILMPKLSDSMEDGTILSWLEKSGARVDAGGELLEIETDKSTVTYVAEATGILEILAAEGTTVPVGQPIARIGEPAPANDSGAGDRPSGHAKPDQDESESAPASMESERADGASAVAFANPFAAATNGSPPATPTPLARRMAEIHGIDLSSIAGTGPRGRITRRDVLATAGVEPEGPPGPVLMPPPVPFPPPVSQVTPRRDTSASSGSQRQELTRLQLVIARRMAEAKKTIPHFQVQTDAVMDETITLRARLKALAGESGAVPSFNDFVIKSAGVALREHPLANGSYRDDAFELHDAINVGMAVAADGALVVPTVFDAASKPLGQIAEETRTLARRVRDGSISPSELEGGTFTVSNLGMFGMTAITPVINPPQAAILGVGSMREQLVRRGEEIVARTLMTLTLSCDHRILYGADAARFLARIRDLLETPLKLALY